jgi:1-aminocyclopropane-1-carboxylate deaminase
MMAGLIKGAMPQQKVVGISVLKGNTSLLQNVKALLTETEKDKQFKIIHDYHFGGYAKHPQPLITWMNDVYQQHQLPTDIVYTSKLLFGITDLQKQGYFADNSKIMVIHSGGLQGNLSLPVGTLVF